MNLDVGSTNQAETSSTNNSSGSDDEATPRIFPPKTLATDADFRRRRSIGPVGYSHSAFRSRDLEATRHFYEDVLGLPLVLSEKGVGERHPTIPGPFDLIHIFFELADGSSIGFFGIEKGKLEPHQFPAHPLQLHFALQMESEQAIHDTVARVNAAGYKTFAKDFGPCYSAYIMDPDGLSIELCYHRKDWFEPIDAGRARQVFDQWVSNGGRWA